MKPHYKGICTSYIYNLGIHSENVSHSQYTFPICHDFIIAGYNVWFQMTVIFVLFNGTHISRGRLWGEATVCALQDKHEAGWEHVKIKLKLNRWRSWSGCPSWVHDSYLSIPPFSFQISSYLYSAKGTRLIKMIAIHTFSIFVPLFFLSGYILNYLGLGLCPRLWLLYSNSYNFIFSSEKGSYCNSVSCPTQDICTRVDGLGPCQRG